MRRFFVTSDHTLVEGEEISLSPQDAHHIKDVLRLSLSERVEVSDGKEHLYVATIISCDKRHGIRLRIEHEKGDVVHTPSMISIAVACLKTRQMSAVLRKSSELGVDCVYPFTCRRSLSGIDAAAQSRWNKIAHESAKQCHRIRLLRIEEVRSLEDILREAGQEYDFAFIADSFDKDTPLISAFVSDMGIADKRLLAIVGPEGGFTRPEIEMAKEHGVIAVGLSDLILTTETAVAFMCSVLMHEKKRTHMSS